MKLEISYKKNTEKYTKTWNLNNMLLNNEQVNNETKEETKRYLETNENGHNIAKSVQHWENNPKREIHSITSLSQKRIKKKKKTKEKTHINLKKNNK